MVYDLLVSFAKLTHTVVKSVRKNPELTHGVGHNQLLSVEFYPHVGTSVPVLVISGCPPTIGGLVVAVVVVSL